MVRSIVATMAISLLVVGSGCASKDAKVAERLLAPTDFAQPRPVSEQVASASRPSNAESTVTAPLVTDNTTNQQSLLTPVAAALDTPVMVTGGPLRQLTGPHPVDAMVGQVNGQAIYAKAVIVKIHDQLLALGQNLSPNNFKQEAEKLIVGRLHSLVIERLSLGEAERDLTPQEQAYLTVLLQKHREELLRLWGLGSENRARVEIQRTTGLTLDETLDRKRQEIVVRRYTHQKYAPLIHVTRKDVMRYYYEHPEIYSPPTQQTLHLIRAKSNPCVRTITQQLDKGTSFIDIAHDSSLNAHNPNIGGLMKTTGDQPMKSAALNEAIAALNPGQHSGAVDVQKQTWWVYIDSVIRPPSRSLRDEQLNIENLLKAEQFHIYSRQYEEDLFESGSYTPLPKMLTRLLDIALTRYQRPK